MLKYQKQSKVCFRFVQMSTFISVEFLTAWHQGWTLSCFVSSFVEQQGVLHTHWILTSGSFLNHCLFPLFGNKLQTVQILDCHWAKQFISAKTCPLFKMNVKSMPWFDFCDIARISALIWVRLERKSRPLILFSPFPALLSETRQTETHKTVAWGWSADGMNYWGLTEADHASSSNAARPTLQFLRTVSNECLDDSWNLQNITFLHNVHSTDRK